MKIVFAKHLGFCSGVKRAVSIAEKSLKKDQKPIWFLGNLVHNEKVMEKFKKEGVRFITSPKQAKSGTLIILAHGFPTFSLKANKKLLLIRDATCPLVKKVQLLASSLYKKGYQVIIIGDRGHSETRGIKSYTKNRAIIIENENQAKIPRFLKKVGDKKIGVVSQTTQNLNKFNHILKILENKAEELKWFNTICPEVTARQKELNKILASCNGILVIGSHSSANTGRLAEMIKKAKKNLWWINSLEELKKINFKNTQYLGVVSGASTPNWEIKKIKKWLLGKKQK